MDNISASDQLFNLVISLRRLPVEGLTTLNEEDVHSLKDTLAKALNEMMIFTKKIDERLVELREIRTRRLLEEEERRVDTIEELINKTTNSMQCDRIERCLTGINDTEKELFVVGVQTIESLENETSHRIVTIRGTLNARGSRSDYRVTVSSTGIKCSCPDATHACREHGLVCKHVSFILLRVGRLLPLYFFNHRSNSPRILSEIDNDRLVKILDDRVALEHFYVSNITNIVIAPNAQDAFISRESDLGDLCPICYEDTPTILDLVECPQCRNTFHRVCMKVWIDAPKSSKTCVLCRWDGWRIFKG